MNILGISCFYHDSAACLVRDGEIIAAAQEERFTRKKHDPNFPENAIKYCLKAGGIDISGVDYVAFYEKPLIKFERIIETHLAYAPYGLKPFLMAIPVWLKDKLWMSELIKRDLKGFQGKLLFPQHHESHAASAFYPSPFEESAFLTIDGVGEWATTSWGVGKGNQLDIKYELRFPHSLGLLYSAFTYYTGFKVNSGEYKVMGLAPYGEPKFVEAIYDNLIDLKNDGSFKLNMDYFNYCAGLTMTNDRFHKLFGGEPRKPESKLTQREMDFAASIQKVTEDIMIKMVRNVKKETGQRYLCLAGGVALNCVANGKIMKSAIFDDLWIQPAAGDSGGALGAALLTWHKVLNGKRVVVRGRDAQKGSYLGPDFKDNEIETFLKKKNIPFQIYPEEKLPIVVGGLLTEGKVIGLLYGRMEFGPRALGARSIIGDARLPAMQSVMNLKIKFRESFRPFAPSVLKDKVSDYFDIDRESPYMLLVADIKKDRQIKMTQDEELLWGIDKLNVIRSEIPAVTHVDYSARIQTVDKETNPVYYAVIEEFYKKTGCPVIINTSFNVRGEPIVCTPEDAYRCFMRTNIDYLILGNHILDKTKQPEWNNDSDWKKEYELD